MIENSAATGQVGMTWLARRHPVVRLALCFCLGICAATGQAPYGWSLVLVLAFASAFAVWRALPGAGATAWAGWAFGTGYFALALVWILEPFQVDAGRHGWMAPFALIFMSGGLALFWGAAFWLARRLSAAAFTLVLVWTAAEVLRAYVLTGFPWATPAQILPEGVSARLLAWVGPHGGNFAILFLAWLLSIPARGLGVWQHRTGQLALLLAAGLALHLPQALPTASGTGKIVRLIQPNAEQHLKWRPEFAELFYRRQLALTASAAGAAPDLVIWPETAIPWRLETAQPVLRQISAAAGGAPVVLGALRTETDGVRNAMAVLDGTGNLDQVYDKHHLVPFGEYIPLAELAARLGISGLAANGAGFSAGPGPAMLDFGALGKALPLICYEAVFAHIVGRAPERPDFLLQITNDAWFGLNAGPQQHLAQARMRAIEQGVPLLRAANTGISAVIDPFGRVVDYLPLGVEGYIDVELPSANNPTLYSRIGDAPLMVFLVLGLIGQQLVRRLGRSANSH